LNTDQRLAALPARIIAEPATAPLGGVLGEETDGRVWKCTLCYDRLKDGHEPACAKACPTDSIQFGRTRRVARAR